MLSASAEIQVVAEAGDGRDAVHAVHAGRRLMAKPGVKDVPALVKFAVEHGLTPSS